jgi:hypothetical protein
MSNLVAHAKAELALLNSGEGDEMQAEMNSHLIKMVEVFAEEGHSGFSAGYAVSVLQKLLRFEPLTPVTGDDGEWHDVSTYSGEPCWQNIRCSHVFKGADGRAWDIDAVVYEYPDGVRFTRGGSRDYIEFPYMPTREVVKVDANGEPT